MTHEEQFPSNPPDRPGWWICNPTPLGMPEKHLGWCVKEFREHDLHLRVWPVIPHDYWWTVDELVARNWLFGGRVPMPGDE